MLGIWSVNYQINFKINAIFRKHEPVYGLQNTSDPTQDL